MDDTYWAKRNIQDARKRMDNMRTDARQKHREHVGECHSCFYLRRPRVAGRSFTEYTCQECGVLCTHPDTEVPKLCEECGKTLGKCRSCLADIADVAKEATEA